MQKPFRCKMCGTVIFRAHGQTMSCAHYPEGVRRDEDEVVNERGSKESKEAK